MGTQEAADRDDCRRRQEERQRIDAAFERMANDSGYQAELVQIERDMAPGSDAAWRMLDEAERRAGQMW